MDGDVRLPRNGRFEKLSDGDSVQGEKEREREKEKKERKRGIPQRRDEASGVVCRSMLGREGGWWPPTVFRPSPELLDSATSTSDKEGSGKKLRRRSSSSCDKSSPR